MKQKNILIKKHRVSGGFDPRNYKYLDQFDWRTVKCHDDDPGEALNPMAEEYGEALHSNGYSDNHCTHCGTNLKSGALYEHTPTGEIIIIGHRCKSRLAFEGPAAFKKHLLEQDFFNKRKLEEFRKSWRWNIVLNFLEKNQDVHSIIFDMLDFLKKHHKISLKQLKLARKVIIDQAERDIEKAKEREILKNAPDWEDGRQTVSCKCIHTKFVESDWGVTTKMLIQLEDARKAWGTMPSKLDCANTRTDDVFELTATFTPSDKDSKFAFFKRPSVKFSKEMEEAIDKREW